METSAYKTLPDSIKFQTVNCLATVPLALPKAAWLTHTHTHTRMWGNSHVSKPKHSYSNIDPQPSVFNSASLMKFSYKSTSKAASGRGWRSATRLAKLCCLKCGCVLYVHVFTLIWLCIYERSSPLSTFLLILCLWYVKY